MPHPLLIFSQSVYLIQIVVINSHTQWQTVQIQISWLLQKPTDLDLHSFTKGRTYPGSAGLGLIIHKNHTCTCMLWVYISNEYNMLWYTFLMSTTTYMYVFCGKIRKILCGYPSYLELCITLKCWWVCLSQWHIRVYIINILFSKQVRVYCYTFTCCKIHRIFLSSIWHIPVE